MRIIILEQWSIIDRWWRPKDEQIRHEYVHVDWNGRKIVFVKKMPEKMWRIYHRPNDPISARSW
jgi:hypothetical protein